MKHPLIFKLLTVIFLLGVSVNFCTFQLKATRPSKPVAKKALYPGVLVGVFSDSSLPGGPFKVYADPSDQTEVDGFIAENNGPADFRLATGEVNVKDTEVAISATDAYVYDGTTYNFEYSGSMTPE